MWDPKKASAPQYSPLYGHNPSGGLPPQSMQHQFQSMPSYPPSMAAQMSQMSQPLGGGMAQGLGPPPPYTPYAEPSQQQMKYMPQMGYPNPNQYPSSASSVTASPLVPPHQQSSFSAAGGPHSYPNPYASSPYPTASLYNPYNPYSNPSLATNSTVVMPQGFDAGARFDGVSRPVIPPPPPGVAPNPAQLAAMQGQNVVIGQKKGSFLDGGSSGGYTFW